MKKADAILGADLHLDDSTPLCRTDNYWEAQKTKLIEIKKLQLKHACPFLIAGDIFNRAKSSPLLEAMAIRECPTMIGVPGQHDLPDHNLEKYINSSLEVLTAAGIFTPLIDIKDREYSSKITFLVRSNGTINLKSAEVEGFAFGTKFEPSKDKKEGSLKIALMHAMVHKDKAIHKKLENTSMAGLSLLKKSNYDLIVTGDNHKPFTVEYEGRLLVNCGSMLRKSADQIDYKPAVWLWYADTNTVEPHYLPIVKDAVSRTHIEDKEFKDNRMNAFVENLNTSYELSLSFRENMEAHFIENKTRKGIINTFRKSLGD